MGLPVLQPDGSLPPGVHQIITLDELFLAFPAITPRRQLLNSSLTRLVETIARLAIGRLLVIDGSYLSGKAEPSDIDCALLSTGPSEPETLRRLNAEGVDLTLLELFVDVTQPRFMQWVQFFSVDRTGSARGVALLSF